LKSQVEEFVNKRVIKDWIYGRDLAAFIKWCRERGIVTIAGSHALTGDPQGPMVNIMMKHILTGFGFGPIQAGLFANEAFQSGNFSRIVIAEIDQQLVDAVRANNGSYYVNVAAAGGIEVIKIAGVEILNPNVDEDRRLLIEALSCSTEILTSLPSVSFYDTGDNSVASIIGSGLQSSEAKAIIVYTAENDNRAAEILEESIAEKIDPSYLNKIQFLNTVIGKMSRVVSEPAEILENRLKPIAPNLEKAFLVEEFNRILVNRSCLSGFEPGIEVFIEKDDLLPFEEAKLYGHNAIHALLAYLGAFKGCSKMKELKNDERIMKIARDAFINESGAALIKKYSHLNDELFTEAGYKIYAEDLLERMTNPYLADTIERAGRDPIRKLGLNDRIFGTMSLALEQGIEPVNMALGAIAGVAFLLQRANENNLPDDLSFEDWRRAGDTEIKEILHWIWAKTDSKYTAELIRYVQKAKERLGEIIGLGSG
jgi:mannitol-1-phosphate 5-dehydrogenase